MRIACLRRKSEVNALIEIWFDDCDGGLRGPRFDPLGNAEQCRHSWRDGGNSMICDAGEPEKRLRL
jgi:hypothetical protein